MVLKCIQAGRNDLDKINLLMRRSKAYWGYDATFMDKFMQLFQVTVDYLEQNAVKFICEFDNNQCHKPVGFYSFSLSEKGEYELDNFFIDPDCIGKGFGRKMWDIFIEDLQLCGVKKFTLWSDPGAEAFYKKMGCTKIGVKKSPMMPNRYPVIFEYRPIKIDFLKHYPDAIPTLATIWHQVLGRIWVPDVPIERVKRRFQEHLNEGQLPLTLVAFCDNKPVGMCSLRETDGIRPDLIPWLGSLVVHPDYQRQGIAPRLINATKHEAKKLGFNQLFLFTFDPTLPEYYSKLGWEKIEMDKFKGHQVNVMKINL